MSFDRLAPHYRWMERVLTGGKLQRCRLAWLGEVRESRNVLVVGEGPGRFLAEAARALPSVRFCCVDASAAMLERARVAWANAGGKPLRAQFVRAELPAWQPPAGAFDLVVTHFFLDCFPPESLAAVVTRLAAAARGDARWLLADFCVPARGAARLRARLVLWAAYSFFRVATRLPARQLATPDACLEAEGFRLVYRRTSDWGLLHSDLWQRGAPASAAGPTSDALAPGLRAASVRPP